MKVIIIEDEHHNVLRLQHLLKDINVPIQVVHTFESVAQSVAFLQQKPDIDLIFLDIHLSDGNGLSILEQTQSSIPVIFTTAYDQYALEAFQFLSVDYLLKPIKPDALQRAIDKYIQNFKPAAAEPSVNQLLQILRPSQYQQRFICRRGKNRFPISTTDIAYIYAEERETWVVTFDNTNYLISKSLDQLEAELAPTGFFRVNRKLIGAKQAVVKFEMLPKSKIKLMLNPLPEFELIISSEKSAAFKQWIRSD